MIDDMKNDLSDKIADPILTRLVDLELDVLTLKTAVLELKGDLTELQGAAAGTAGGELNQAGGLCPNCERAGKTSLMHQHWNGRRTCPACLYRVNP